MPVPPKAVVTLDRQAYAAMRNLRFNTTSGDVLETFTPIPMDNVLVWSSTWECHYPGCSFKIRLHRMNLGGGRAMRERMKRASYYKQRKHMERH